MSKWETIKGFTGMLLHGISILLFVLIYSIIIRRRYSLSQYKGSKQHGYWALHCNNGLQYHSKSCHGVKPGDMFQGWQWIEWWHIRCELDWYRMMKEYKVLAEGPLVPIKA